MVSNIMDCVLFWKLSPFYAFFYICNKIKIKQLNIPRAKQHAHVKNRTGSTLICVAPKAFFYFLT